MNQIQTLFGLISIEDLAQTGIVKKSTLYKISSKKLLTNTDANGFLESFPRPVKLGRRIFWKISDIQKYLEEVEQGRLVRPAHTPDQCTVGRGRPRRAEVSAAAACGLSVREWRAGNRVAVVVGGDHGHV